MLNILAQKDDGAFLRDGVGFNRDDSERGNDLANSTSLNDEEAKEAKAMLYKYFRQLPEIPFNKVYGKDRWKKIEARNPLRPHPSRTVYRGSYAYSGEQDYDWDEDDWFDYENDIPF